MQTQAAKSIRTAEDRVLDAAIAHLESVHRVAMQKNAACKVIPFPPRACTLTGRQT